MSDEYNLTWEQADICMQRGAIVKTNYCTRLRFNNGKYEFLFYGTWLHASNRMNNDVKYKIDSIPECEKSYKESSFKIFGIEGKSYTCLKCMCTSGKKDNVMKNCIDNFMKKLCPFKIEEPKMTEELMSFDEAVAWLLKNGGNVFFIEDNQKLGNFAYAFGSDIPHFRVNGSSVDINKIRDKKFSKTPIKIEPVKNGLGLEENQEISVSCKKFEIEKALKIYIELLKHPLVARAVHGERQHVITCLGGEVIQGLITEDYHGSTSKADHLSPVFNSTEDARKAISDIGKDSLLFMFKTLKGL